MSRSQIKSEVVPSLANHFVGIPGWQGSVVSDSFCQRSVRQGSCNVFHNCFCHLVQSTNLTSNITQRKMEHFSKLTYSKSSVLKKKCILVKQT